MKYICPTGGCVYEGTKKNPPPRTCPDHASVLVYEKQLQRSTLDRTGKETGRRRAPLKQGRGFAVHPAQREKIKDLPCIVTGQDRHEATIHPMHVWDRGRGGCDDPLCVVPARADIHRLYDEHKLDILSALISRGYFAELAHVLQAHEVSPTRLLERVTGTRWAPVEEPSQYREAVA